VQLLQDRVHRQDCFDNDVSLDYALLFYRVPDRDGFIAQRASIRRYGLS
jgi:hypothetical protein